MARFVDVGPYAVGNVATITNRENLMRVLGRDGRKRKRWVLKPRDPDWCFDKLKR